MWVAGTDYGRLVRSRRCGVAVVVVAVVWVVVGWHVVGELVLWDSRIVVCCCGRLGCMCVCVVVVLVL